MNKSIQLMLGFLVLMTGMNAMAQKDCVRDLKINGCLVKEDGKYGVKRNNKYLIPSYFDTIVSVGEMYFIVKQNERWGLFNNKGAILVPVSYFNITTVDESRGLFEISGHGTKNIALINDAFRMQGFIRLNEKLNVNQTEVSVFEYLCFMQFIADENPDWISMEMAAPDTVCMDSRYLPAMRAFYRGQPSGCKMIFNEKMGLGAKFECSFSKSATAAGLLQLPISCISFEQAVLFNRYMSEKFTEAYTKENSHFYAIARLPHPYEWEEMAYTGIPDDMKKNGQPDSLNAKGCMQYNYRSAKGTCAEKATADGKIGSGTTSVKEFSLSENKTYQVFGNVMEMTSEKKLCKGGSYMNYAKDCKYDRIMVYSSPQPWLGFRYIIEIRRKE